AVLSPEIGLFSVRSRIAVPARSDRLGTLLDGVIDGMTRPTTVPDGLAILLPASAPDRMMLDIQGCLLWTAVLRRKRVIDDGSSARAPLMAVEGTIWTSRPRGIDSSYQKATVRIDPDQAMPLYFFNLKDGRGIVPDPQGIELPDEGSAQAYAREVARELLRNREAARRSWRLQVCDSAHEALFEILFADADQSLDYLPPELKASLKEVYVKTGSLADTISDVRATVHQLKGTLSNVDRSPRLAAI